MSFLRPSHLPYPNIWSRFTTDRGTLRIQDLTEDMWEQAMDLLTTYFTRDEPPCKYIEIHKYPTAVMELQKLWRNTLKDNLSIACVVDDDVQPPRIVGVNVLTVISKEDKEEPFQIKLLACVARKPLEIFTRLPEFISGTPGLILIKRFKKTEDPVWAQLFGAVDLVARSVDIFAKYGVNKYLTAYGLVVDPQWRGCGVGKELLLVRVPLCKALDVKVTVTVFTAGASQVVAKKAGFEDLYEITYEELANKGFVFPNIENDTKTSKLMALVIN